VAGVDYASASSALLEQSDVVGDVSTWLSTPELVADVQGWLDSDGTNFGWMLINTNETSKQTFRGFYSKDFNPDPSTEFEPISAFRPQLIVTYTPEPSAILLLVSGIAALIPLRRIARARNDRRLAR
jgi:hypothetical protein